MTTQVSVSIASVSESVHVTDTQIGTHITNIINEMIAWPRLNFKVQNAIEIQALTNKIMFPQKILTTLTPSPLYMKE